MGVYCTPVLYMNYVIDYSCISYVIRISEAETGSER